MSAELWEFLGDGTYRMRVPGGWLYRWSCYSPTGPCVSMCFVPEPVEAR